MIDEETLEAIVQLTGEDADDLLASGCSIDRILRFKGRLRIRLREAFLTTHEKAWEVSR